MASDTTLFAAVPKLKDLCYICCTFSRNQMTREFVKQVYHCQIVFCRDIIKCFSKAIASPVPSKEYHVYVIVSKKFYETKKLQEYLEGNLIAYTEPQAVNFEIYKTCLKYSIIYKLLPVWNRVGNYLCKGKKSTEITDELDAVKFDVDIREDGMFLTFNTLKLKLHPLSLEAIEVSKQNLEKYRKTPNVAIRFINQSALILPSLKRCKLLRVMKELPNSCDFKYYDVIRDHWKHMYGIVLPKSPEGIDYFEICFRGFDHRIFVYPGVCLQKASPEVMRCDNQAEIVDQFLEDLKVKVPQICGKELSFEYPLIVKNPCFKDKSDKLGVYDYDPKTSLNFSLEINFNDTSKSYDSNLPYISFNEKLSMKEELNIREAENSSKMEFVRHWLLNSCTSPTRSVETESHQSRNGSENSNDSPLEKRRKLSDVEKPTIRSIESIKISLPDLKKGQIKKLEQQTSE